MSYTSDIEQSTNGVFFNMCSRTVTEMSLPPTDDYYWLWLKVTAALSMTGADIRTSAMEISSGAEGAMEVWPQIQGLRMIILTNLKVNYALFFLMCWLLKMLAYWIFIYLCPKKHFYQIIMLTPGFCVLIHSFKSYCNCGTPFLLENTKAK